MKITQIPKIAKATKSDKNKTEVAKLYKEKYAKLQME